MLDHPIATEGHQLEQALAFWQFAQALPSTPGTAAAAVRQAFGLGDQVQDELLYCAMLLLAGQRFDEARTLLVQVAEQDPQSIAKIYALLAVVFKYANTGLPIDQLVLFAVAPLLQIWQRWPDSLAAQQAMLDMLLYLGQADDAAQVLSRARPGTLRAEAAALASYQQALASYHEQCRLSIVLLTFQRPRLLAQTLQALRAALVERDVELIIGVNDDWPETRQVLEQAGADQVHFFPANVGINGYKQLFAMAQGRYIIELDDDIFHLPAGFDQQIVTCLESEPMLGLVGHWPVGFVDAISGASQLAAPSFHQQCQVAGLPFGLGPVAGVCAGLRRRDFLQINGFFGATLSHLSGEEPQLIRKLAAHGKVSGVIFDQGLRVVQGG